MLFKKYSLIILFFLGFSTISAELTITEFEVHPNARYDVALPAINRAQSKIDLVVYSISDPLIIDALVQAKNRGVAVRILLNGGYPFRNQESKEYLESLGLNVRLANSNFITHQKTFIFDDSSSLIMTYNLLESYFVNHRDFGALITTPAAVAQIEQVFDDDWNLNPVAIVPHADLVWSPINSRSTLVSLIYSANHTLEIYNEEMADTEVEDALIAAAQRGVKVRVILSPPSIENPFVQVYDFEKDSNARGLHKINQKGVEVFLVAVPYIHAKMILVDRDYPNAVAFLGSENFSYSSLNFNRELGLVTHKSSCIEQMYRAFEFDWGFAKNL